MRAANPLMGLCVLLILTACGRGDSNAGPVVRDSAGVRIVENTTGSWAEAEEWRLGAAPILDIGGVEGDPTQELFRVNDAARLPDGRVVIANAGTQELLFYDADGTRSAVAGGRGGGPGEFETMFWHQIIHDTIVVANRRPARLSFFDFEGRFVRSARFEANLLGVFVDGTVLASQSSLGDNPQDGLFRSSSILLRFGVEGEAVDTLGSIPGSESFLQVSDQSVSITRSPLMRSTWTFVHRDRYYVAINDRYEVGVFGSDGALLFSVRKKHEIRPITDAVLEAYIEERLRDAGDDEARRQRVLRLREITLPPTLPAFGWNTNVRSAPVLVDDLDHLWVLEYNEPDDKVYRWTVFNPEGLLLGEVPFPDALEPFHIGADFVLGKSLDAFDVEHVVLYELIKS